MNNKVLKIAMAMAILIMIAAVSAGCAAPAPAAAPVAEEETAPAEEAVAEEIVLRTSMGAEPTSIDPNLAQDTYAINSSEGMFLGLTNINNVTADIEPELATHWDISEDGTVWTFHLRDDAMWTDGKPVTAHDIEYSVRRAIMPETASPYAYVLYIIKNAQAINQTDVSADEYDLDTLGVTALDDYTVEFTLEAPASYFLAISSLWTLRPVPQWAIEEHGDAWTEAENVVSNGPYILEEWKHGESMAFVKNPDYYDADNVQIDRVEVDIITDQYTEVALYESGELDIAGDGPGTLPAEEMARILEEPVLAEALHIGPRASTTYVGFTMTKPPFDDPLVRKAFSAAIDREVMVRDVVGSGVPATQFAPPGIFGAPDPEVGLATDVAQAQAWLAEAGYPDGEGFPTVTYRYFSSSLEEALGEALQAMWKEALNVDVQLESQEWPVFIAGIGPDTPLEEMPEMWRLGWGADYADENNWVREVFHCTDSTNYSRAECTEADEMALQAALETDPEVRKELYAQVEQLMFGEELRAAPYYHRGYTILTKPYVQRSFPTFAPVNWDTWRIER
ncbi:MAG: peptide ABC transporter substrate-binding protein [Chloroflexi bacterium]|nr:peptide ABC transporter substrate-binding protein [Chloroflexota bacterium]